MAILVLGGCALSASGSELRRSDDPRPNILLILTDDQSLDSFPSNPPAMPWLQSRVFDPHDHWLRFPNAVVSTPLCCPSRTTILTGQYSEHTGVLNNELGHVFDESNTLPVWLHEAGYTTALVGKYLNEYPFHRPAYIPPGWDRFVAKENASIATTYYGYPLVDGGIPLQTSNAPEDYATDFLADDAVGFLRSAPDAPWFLEFAPSAPHGPITPPQRYAGAFAGVSIPAPASFGEADVSDKPAWVRALPQLSGRRPLLALERERESEALLSVDDAVRRLMAEIAARGDLGRTVVFFLTDNGYSFGAHRWVGKQCPYEECIRTPFAVRVPWAASGTRPNVISTVDLAPTIASFAGTAPDLAVDGSDVRPLIDPHAGETSRALPKGALIEYLGGELVPNWVGVRTRDFTYVEYADGERELYDLTGRAGPADPGELENRVSDPAYQTVRNRLALLLRTLRGR